MLVETKKLFPSLSQAKIEAGVFTGPQIRKLFASNTLDESMTLLQVKAWNSLHMVIKNFLGNTRAIKYASLIADMIKNFKSIHCRMSLKLHMLHSHLDFFSTNMGAVSDEHGERFHQQIAKLEQRYHKQCDVNMMGDYIWLLVRDQQ